MICYLYHKYLLGKLDVTPLVHTYMIYTTLLVPKTMKQNQSSIRQKFMINYKKSVPTSVCHS